MQPRWFAAANNIGWHDDHRADNIGCLDALKVTRCPHEGRLLRVEFLIENAAEVGNQSKIVRLAAKNAAEQEPDLSVPQVPIGAAALRSPRAAADRMDSTSSHAMAACDIPASNHSLPSRCHAAATCDGKS